MTKRQLETDYLVVGAGATAMAFVDTLLSESPQATITLVDRRHKPGGHWNDAYPFVRLHQPSAYYGVASRELSSWTRDRAGLNEGLYSLASGQEVLSHFEQVLEQRFLPSGRVRWLPMSDYSRDADGTHRVRSLTSGEQLSIQVRRKLVDGTLARTEVPATHPPRFEVAAGVRCIPINGLPGIDRPYASCCVIGSGKTGIDAVLWLMQNGVPPTRIRWIMPRDAWWLDRANSQPGAEDFRRTLASSSAQFEAIAAAQSLPDLLQRLDQRGLLLRLDPRVEPSCYRCAVVSQAELAQLRRVEDVVRLGRVRALQPGRIVLEQGDCPAEDDTLYINCSAGAIQMPPARPVFDGEQINLLMVRWCQPLFSAALIAWVESHVPDGGDASAQNALCAVVPSPEHPRDWLRMWGVTLLNTARWRQNPALNTWLSLCRLNGTVATLRGVDLADPVNRAVLADNASKAAAAAARIPALLAAA